MQNDKDTTIGIFTYGGGMRGLIPAYIMARLEERTGLRMAEMVDIFSGPSTGAILNAALTRPHPHNPSEPLYRARHLVKFYLQKGIKIFPSDRFREFRGILHDFNNRTLKLSQMNNLFRHGHYDPRNLQRSLDALYGDARLSDSLSSLIIPTYNIDGEQLIVPEETDETGDTPARTKNNVVDSGGHAVWLKNIKTGHPDSMRKRCPDVSLYDAVMASCAAPTYFPCHHFSAKYRDERKAVEYTGIDGVIFDNPCISYLGAIRRHVPQDKKLSMIVLGTGYTNRSIKKEDWNRFGSLGVVDPVNDLPLINIFFHASESALMDSFEEEMGDNLFIFNKSMSNSNAIHAPSIQIDDARPENLKALRVFAEELMEEQADKMDAVCHLLVNQRDRRQEEKEEGLMGAAKSYYYKLTDRRNRD